MAMSEAKKLSTTEPIWLQASVTPLFQALLGFLQAFQIVRWNETQALSVHGVLLGATTFIGAWWARRNSIPVAHLEALEVERAKTPRKSTVAKKAAN